MALKDTWVDKRNGVDINSADDINQVARAVIDLEEKPAPASSAKDITLGAPFVLTQDFGYYKLNGATSEKFGNATDSLHKFLQGAFAQDDRTIFSSLPNCSISISGDSEGEIGTTTYISAKWSEIYGAYKWGTMDGDTPNFTNKETGITYDTGAISATSGTLNANHTFTSEVYTVEASGTFTRSAVKNRPISMLGEDIYNDLVNNYPYYTSGKTDDATASKTFTGYRKMFYGATNSGDTIDGAFIRNLSGEKAAKKTIEVKALASSGHKKIIWAIPKSLTTITPTFNYWFNNEWHTLSNVSETVVNVRGAGTDTGEDYNVYIYAPAGGVFEADMKTQMIIK